MLLNLNIGRGSDCSFHTHPKAKLSDLQIDKDSCTIRKHSEQNLNGNLEPASLTKVFLSLFKYFSTKFTQYWWAFVWPRYFLKPLEIWLKRWIAIGLEGRRNKSRFNQIVGRISDCNYPLRKHHERYRELTTALRQLNALDENKIVT